MGLFVAWEMDCYDSVFGFVLHVLFFIFVITQSFNPSFPGFPIDILFTPIAVIYIVALIKIRKLFLAHYLQV